MVSCISKGRYGNFCFANMAAWVYSYQHQLDFHIQDRTLAPHMWPLYHQHLKHPNWDKSLPTVYINDDGHRYRELPFEYSWRTKNIIIGTTDIKTGYFQSYRYLQYCEHILVDQFIGGDVMHKGCAIHVRRGDYTELSHLHPVITEKYLDESIGYMVSRGVRAFKFFSDDIKWCKEFYVKEWVELRNKIDFYFSEGNEISDFKEMVHFEHQIVANSSFSVLAAILNPNPNKIIICPDEESYMGPQNKHLDVTDLYPANWIRIKY